MTPAEKKFKETVLDLLAWGIYPSGKEILWRVGRIGRNLNGREMRWRERVLLDAGFHYDGGMHMYKWRHSDWKVGPRR